MFIKADQISPDLAIPPPRVLSSGRMLVTQDQRNLMVKLYDQGFSTWKIGEAFGYLNVCVINNLRKAGVKLRNRSDANKTLEVNRDYFREIDTHTKAYLLGLFYADGNVHKDTFTIVLQDRDKYLLESIAKEIGMTGRLGFRKPRGITKRDAWSLRVYDKEFCSHLRKWGIVPRKTSRLEFPEFLDKQFTYSFLHGLLDGDGCVSVCQANLAICFAGSSRITGSIKAILEKDLDVRVSWHATKNSKGTTATVSGKSAILVLEKLYKESKGKFLMSRKRDKFIEFMKWKTSINHGEKQYQDLCNKVLKNF